MKNLRFIKSAENECLFQASKNIAQLYFSYLCGKKNDDVFLTLAATDLGVFVLWAVQNSDGYAHFLPAFIDDLPFTDRIDFVKHISFIDKDFVFTYHNHIYFFDGEKIFNILILDSQLLLESYAHSLGWSENNCFSFTQMFVNGIFKRFISYGWKIFNWDTGDYCFLPAFFCPSDFVELPFKNNGVEFSFEYEDIHINEPFKFGKVFWILNNSAEKGLFIEPIGLNFSKNHIIC